MVLNVSIHDHKRAAGTSKAEYAFVEFAHANSVVLALDLSSSGRARVSQQKVYIYRCVCCLSASSCIILTMTSTGWALKSSSWMRPERPKRIFHRKLQRAVAVAAETTARPEEEGAEGAEATRAEGERSEKREGHVCTGTNNRKPLSLQKGLTLS